MTGVQTCALPICDVTPDKTDNIKSIAVTKTPDKTEYFAGEEFTAVGGEITVTYRDGTKEVISMTDPDVSFLGNTIAVSDPSLTIQNKNVTVVYGEKEATFRIRVSLVLYTVTFEYNDDSVGNKTEKVKNGERVKEPEDPERDEYIFDGWYSDKQCTMLFDFGSVITKDTSIYRSLFTARQKRSGAFEVCRRQVRQSYSAVKRRHCVRMRFSRRPQPLRLSRKHQSRAQYRRAGRERL